MLDGLVHREPDGRGLFAGNDHVDVVAAAQAMVGDGEQAIGIGRQIDPDDFGFLVDDVVMKPRVLVREAVVRPGARRATRAVIERGDGRPGNVIADLQPLGVLVEHRIDDVDERLVTGEEPVPPVSRYPSEPALALMFAQHFHDPAVGEDGRLIEPVRQSRRGWSLPARPASG